MNEFYVIMFDNNTFFCQDDLNVLWYQGWNINNAVRFKTESLACNAISVNKLPTNKITVLRRTENDLTPKHKPVYHYVIVLENENYYSAETVDSLDGVPDLTRASKFKTREEADYYLLHCNVSSGTVIYIRTDEEEPMIFEDSKRGTIRHFEAAKFSVCTGERTSTTKYFSSIELGEIESRNMGWYNSPGTFLCMEPMIEVTLADGTVFQFAETDAIIIISETEEEKLQREENLRQKALSKLTMEEKIALGLLTKK